MDFAYNSLFQFSLFTLWKSFPFFALLDLQVVHHSCTPELHSFAAPEETHSADYFSL